MKILSGKKIVVQLYTIMIYLAFTVLMLLAVNQKSNLYIDEVFSYVSSNSARCGVYDIQDGQTYYPPNSLWLTELAVTPPESFQYDVVWRNQRNDTHPPLYYAVLHTICSLFPNLFSIWFAAAINIISAWGVLFFARKIMKFLSEDIWARELMSLGLICSAGILSSVTFLRMYVMAMFWVTALTYMVLKRIWGRDRNLYIDCAVIALLTAGGTLTHYYVTLYAVLLCTLYGCYLLAQKRRKELASLCVAQGIAAIVCICIFPAMLSHIFSGDRGTESFDNLITSSHLWHYIKNFWHILDVELFGGLLKYTACAALIFLIFYIKQKTYRVLTPEQKNRLSGYFCVLGTILLYFLLISRIAVSESDRYMYPIYGVLFPTVTGGVIEWLYNRETPHYRYALAAILLIMGITGGQNGSWAWLFQDSKPLLEFAQEHHNTDCIYIYHLPMLMGPDYEEASNYNSITCYQSDSLDMLKNSDLSIRYELILMIMNDLNQEEILNRVIAECPEINAYEPIGSYGFSNTYRLYIRYAE